VVIRRKPIDEPLPSLTSSVRLVVKRWLVQLIVLLIVVGLLLTVVLWLGSYAREQLREHDRFQFVFADIDCNPPSPLERQEFLAEVRWYDSALPERFSILEGGLSARLQEGFAKHPWVAQVEKVEVVPPRSVRVSLEFRQPVLAVVVTPDLAGAKLKGLSLRAVDDKGVLLPKKVPLEQDLPILHLASRPSGGEGQFWGDPGVRTAAETAAFLRLSSWRRAMTIQTMTIREQSLVMWGAHFKVIWGSPHESAKADEASEEDKYLRLSKVLSNRKPSEEWWPFVYEYDLRPRGAMIDRLVFWDAPNNNGVN
jgi:hypothetical protein